MRELMKEVFKTLFSNVFRTLVVVFCVGWGLLMLIVVLGAGKGLENGITKNYAGTSSNAFFIWGRTTSKPYMGMSKKRNIRFTNSDIDYIKKNVPELKYMSARNQLGGYRGGNNVTRKGKSGAFQVNGDFPEIIKINRFRLSSGRFINPTDIKNNRKVAVIGGQVKNILFDKNEDPIGGFLEINGVYFQVVGTFQSTAGDNEQERYANSILIPFSTFQNAFNMNNKVRWFAFTAKKQFSAEFVENKVKLTLAKKHKVDPTDLQAFGSYNEAKEFNRLKSIFKTVNSVGWFVGIMTLFAGLIAVSNIMLITINERTQEFGIRRALGATPFQVLLHVMIEALFLTLVSGYLGLVIGVWGLELFSYLDLRSASFNNPSIDIKTALLASLILIISGILAGILPAVKAMKIKPIEALRFE